MPLTLAPTNKQSRRRRPLASFSENKTCLALTVINVFNNMKECFSTEIYSYNFDSEIYLKSFLSTEKL